MTRARRQQYRHLTRGARHAVAAAAILLMTMSVWRSGGEVLLVFTFLLLAAGLSSAARRSKRLAGRCRVGADSERAVRLALSQVARSGWTVRNGACWPGGGDIDHLVRSPDGLGVAIETKTPTLSRQTSAAERGNGALGWRAPSTLPTGVIPFCTSYARGASSLAAAMW